MRELTLDEVANVNGGDSWAGTPEGQAPASDTMALAVGGVTAGLIILLKTLAK